MLGLVIEVATVSSRILFLEAEGNNPVKRVYSHLLIFSSEQLQLPLCLLKLLLHLLINLFEIIIQLSG